jgi:hypothetical protein
MARISAAGRARRARRDRCYLIERLDAPFLYLEHDADGATFWTADHDKARRFDDAAAAQDYAAKHIGQPVRIIGRVIPR